MYYLKDGLGSYKGCKQIGAVLAVLFSAFCLLASFGIGNMSQVNSIAANMTSAFSIPATVTGIVLVIIGALVIVGGLKRIAAVTEKLVPFMAIAYVIGALVIFFANIGHVGAVFTAIFKGAFGLRAVGGGIVGSGVKLCTENEDGKITVDLMNDRVLGLIEKARVLFADYKPNTNSDSLHQALRENRFIFSQHYTSSAFTRYRDVEADYSILPIPKYDEAQGSYYSMLNPWMYAFAAFPLYVNAEKSAVVSEAMARYSYDNVRPVVYEDGFKLKGARDSDSAKMLDLIFDTVYLDNNAVYDFGGSMTILSKAVFLGNDFVSAYTSAEPKIEADIAKLYE